MTDDFDGADLLDSSGKKVGSIERTYVDGDGQARFLGLKRGTLRPTHQLVPADAVQQSEGGIQVPYDKDTIEGSPSIDAGDTLEGDALGEVRAYYANAGAGEQDDDEEADDPDIDDSGGSGAKRESLVSPIPSDPIAAATVGEVEQHKSPTKNLPERQPSESPSTDEGVPTRIGEIRDLGDVLEIPIVEEVLVRKPVVREVLRVRKTVQTNTVTAEDDLRREDVEVDSDSRESSTSETA